jgi:hypothetical protein
MYGLIFSFTTFLCLQLAFFPSSSHTQRRSMYGSIYTDTLHISCCSWCFGVTHIALGRGHSAPEKKSPGLAPFSVFMGRTFGALIMQFDSFISQFTLHFISLFFMVFVFMCQFCYCRVLHLHSCCFTYRTFEFLFRFSLWKS